jgi:8-oxo-dGTP pyrophosphatase MutT (NUDIX family)
MDADPTLRDAAATATMRSMHTAVLDLVTRHLPAEGTIFAPGLSAEDLGVTPARLRGGALVDLAQGSCVAAVLVDEGLSHAGVHAEETVDTLGAVLEPGGVLAASVFNRVFATASGRPLNGVRGYSSTEAAALLQHRGFTLEVLCAPGAAAGLRGSAQVLDRSSDDWLVQPDAARFDLDADRQPGLLDAAPRLLMIARAPRDADERARVFFETRSRKLAAAATLCRDADGRLLVVYDRFRRIWTLPGGVIDADEDPATAAQRETWEEAGVKVETGPVLGIFAARWPDRLTLVYAADPVTMIEHPEPVHPHEIGGVAWLPMDEALQRLAPSVVFRVTRCLEQPGHSWVQ